MFAAVSTASITFTNLTRAIEIGANSYLLEIQGKRLVLDAGLHPRIDGEGALPRFELAGDQGVDAVVLTHAHQDHIGSLPVLLRRNPKAPVFMTEATAALGDVMLHNSVNVMTRRAEELGAGAVLFTHREVDLGGKRWRSVPLHQRFDLTGERLRPDEAADVALEFFDAGHILGSAGVLIETGGKRIFYTGDVNFEDQTVMQGARFPREPLDVLIVETTRGDHATAPEFKREAEELRFAAALRQVLERGGSAFIPLFALGKTQEMLALFHEFQRKGLLGAPPIYIGGLSTKLTEIHDRLAGRTSRQKSHLQLLDAHGLFTLAGPEAMTTKLRGGRIYALSSGMMTEKTPSNVLARQILSNPEHALLFVGYADPESPAGRVQATAQGQEVQLSPDAPPQRLLCTVDQFSFSGHGTRESIRAYIKEVQPKTVVLVHGDPPAVRWFQEALQADLPQSRIVSPTPGEAIDLL
jgi:Cft2 family RNA processing exonuclease